ncbi:MAG: MMPL family transporter [Bdellovibrionales bacterium]|nr:MMPL family transporter [Bdellovibrionales bacterium]
MLARLLKWNLRTRFFGLAFALLVAGLGVVRGASIPVRLSLADLLPEHRPSVTDLKAVSEDVGGTGYLIVLVGPVDNPQTYLPRLGKEMETNPLIRYTFHEREEYLLRNKSLYLMPRREFDDLLSSGRLLLRGGKNKGFLGLGSEEAASEKELERARAKVAGLRGKGGSRWFLSADRRYAMLLAKPAFDSEDLGKSRVMIEQMESLVARTLPGVPFRLVGRFIDKVNDTRQIGRDIQFTGWVSMLGILAVLTFGIGAFRGSLLTVLVVTVAMGWTVGAAHAFVGQINILTGFLLAILGGMGVEYGVHLIRRYYQERAAGHTHESALESAYLSMARTLGSAAITSSAAFLILSYSDFRGFSELGKIAGAGILSIYAVYVLCFPFLGMMLRRTARFGSFREAFGWYPYKTALRWAVPIFAGLMVWGILHAEFEYNFRRMHALSKDTQHANHFVNDLFGRSFTPAAMQASSHAQARELRAWLGARERSAVIQEAVALHQIVPADADERWEEMERLGRQIRKLTDEEITAKTGVNAAKIRALLDQKPYGRVDLPPHINEAFGRSGNIVLAYPAQDLDIAQSLRSFARILTEARDRFPGVKIGSDVRVFSEILDHITRDGVIILAVFLLGAFVVFWLDFRSVRDALELEAQLVLGIFVLIGLMGLVGERFSILNVAMVPAVLAAGIDMGVHVRHREREGFGALASGRFVAQAVHVSALTTIIGFGALFFAQAGILKGIAWISVLGQISMYLICMVVWPVLRGNRATRPAGRGRESGPHATASP